MNSSNDRHVTATGLWLMVVGLMSQILASGAGAQVDAAVVPANPSTDVSRWLTAGSLNTARVGHTATLLRNGKVLVVGGGPAAELFDPATNRWSVTGDANKSRISHTATLLQDGRVLIVGGYVFDAVVGRIQEPAVELYDPAVNRWVTTGNTLTIRIDHTATLLPDGRVLVAGGAPSMTATTSAELYDPVTGTWTLTGGLKYRRLGHVANLLQDGKVLVSGGMSSQAADDAIGETEEFDPRTGAWTMVGMLGHPRLGHAATSLANGNVMVIGGWYAFHFTEVFVAKSGTWTSSLGLNYGRQNATATSLPDGNVLVVGGRQPNLSINDQWTDVATAELLDVSGKRWLAVGDLLTARHGHTATLLQDGRVLIVGGETTAWSALSSAELYGPVPSGAITSAYTGSWYDPAQSGQGLFVEILPDSRFFAGWFTFNPAGTEQAWFVGVGTYNGNTATIAAMEKPSGGRWIPNFDPARVTHNTWGRLTFTFTDCNHGKVDFNSTAGYGSGSMNLTRLTQPAGLACP